MEFITTTILSGVIYDILKRGGLFNKRCISKQFKKMVN